MRTAVSLYKNPRLWYNNIAACGIAYIQKFHPKGDLYSEQFQSLDLHAWVQSK